MGLREPSEIEPKVPVAAAPPPADVISNALEAASLSSVASPNVIPTKDTSCSTVETESTVSVTLCDLQAAGVIQ